jgi:hypothetical protein
MPISDVSRRVDHVFYQTLLRVRQRVDQATFAEIAKDLESIDLDSACRRSLERLLTQKLPDQA